MHVNIVRLWLQHNVTSGVVRVVDCIDAWGDSQLLCAAFRQ